MDFSYSEVQLMLQDSVQKFVQKSYDHDARTKIVDSEDGYSKENWQLFAELGWLAVPFTEEDGGFGGSAVDLIVMMEEFGKANLVEPFTATAVLGGGLIAELAGGTRKTELIEQVVTGSLQLACAYAESGSRFNLGKVTTTAANEGNNIVINGNKIAVLNASNADKILLVAREYGADTDAEGISIFLVDTNAEGLAITPFTTFDGKKSSEVLFENVRVPESARLGSSGQALDALQKIVDRATVGVSAEAVGALESLLKKTVEYSKTRKQFGTVIGTGLGLSLTYYVQENGIDYTKGIEALSNSSMVMPNIFYAQVTPDLLYIGFFPGVLATVFGTMLAGLAIYKREMSQLFKELET